jgi:hypothetical protein
MDLKNYRPSEEMMPRIHALWEQLRQVQSLVEEWSTIRRQWHWWTGTELLQAPGVYGSADQEQEFRRGFRAGYEQAIEELGGKRPARAVQKFIEALEAWENGDCSSCEYPPSLEKGAAGVPPAAPQYLALRFRVLKRDGYRCRLCGLAARDRDDVRLEVDHITPRSKGGSNDLMNMQTLCFACNRGKGTQDL